MHGIRDALRSAARRLIASETIAAFVAALAVAGIVPEAFAAPVEYDYSGANFTTVSGAYTTADHVSGFVTLDSPLLPSTTTTDPTVDAYSFTDGINTISNATVGAQFLTSSFTTGAAGQILGADVTVSVGNGSPSSLTAQIDVNELGDLAIFASGNGHGSFTGGQAHSAAAGTWSGPIIPPPPPSACATIVNNRVSEKTSAGPYVSLNGDTLITGSFTPAGGSSLSAAETACKFSGFDWVSTETIPAPSPFYTNNNPAVRFVGGTNDPPPSGWTYFNTDPAEAGANPYPYYYTPVGGSGPSGASVTTHEVGNTLNFTDAPTDPCLPPVPVLGIPIGGYDNVFWVPSACAGQIPAPAGTALKFHTQLVGVIPVGSPCPADGGLCLDQDLTDNGSPNPLSIGSICPVGESCYETLSGDYFNWIDTFNAFLAGGISADYEAEPLSANSGAGGITILDVGGQPLSSVPEPSSLAMLVVGVCGISGLKWLGTRKVTNEAI